GTAGLSGTRSSAQATRSGVSEGAVGASEFRGASAPRGELLLDVALHRGPAEEVRARRRPQLDRVSEDELAELVLGEERVLALLPGLGQRLAHVGHVPVADVRAPDRAQLRAEGVAPRVPGRRVQRVVGLAAEEEGPREELADLLGALD